MILELTAAEAEAIALALVDRSIIVERAALHGLAVANALDSNALFALSQRVVAAAHIDVVEAIAAVGATDDREQAS